MTASPAQDCCVIALDWLVMLAKEDTTDQSSIPALSRRDVVINESFKTAGKTEIEELGHKAFLNKTVFISVSAGCSSEFLGKINLFIFYYPNQKVFVATGMNVEQQQALCFSDLPIFIGEQTKVVEK